MQVSLVAFEIQGYGVFSSLKCGVQCAETVLYTEYSTLYALVLRSPPLSTPRLPPIITETFPVFNDDV